MPESGWNDPGEHGVAITEAYEGTKYPGAASVHDV
jgi:hypothetical protein